MGVAKVIFGNETLIDLTADTVTPDDLLSGKKAHNSAGEIITGSMTNNGSVTGTIGTVSENYAIPNGYHDGFGTVSIDNTEKGKIIPANIKAGVILLGVEGTYGGEGTTAQSKTVTPSVTSQTILPDSEYDYLSQVTVEAISYSEIDNAAGGKTVIIAGM